MEPSKDVVPIDVQLHPADRLLEIRLSGELSTEEMLRFVDELASHSDFPGGGRMLSDHRLLEQVGTLDQVEALLDRLRSYGPVFRDTRWAIVTTRAESYGMMRVLSALAQLRNGMEVQVFSDMESAHQWLVLAESLPGDGGLGTRD